MTNKTNNQPTVRPLSESLDRHSAAARPQGAAALMGPVRGSDRDQHWALTQPSHTLNHSLSLHVNR